MGEARRKRTATQALIEQHPECCLCGGTRHSVTRDHIPPKALFDNSHRPDDIVVPACSECNNGTSTSDLIASIVARWRYGAQNTELADHHRLANQLRKQGPEVVAEWIKLGPFERMGAKLHLYEQGILLPPDAGIATIGPKTIPHLTLFAHKITLGLYFWNMKSILPAEGAISSYWRTKEDYLIGAISKELLDLFPNHDFLKQGKWDERETFEYRYSLNQEEGLFGCVARCRGGLFVVGLASANAASVEGEGGDWIRPADVLSILTDPRHEKRR